MDSYALGEILMITREVTGEREGQVGPPEASVGGACFLWKRVIGGASLGVGRPPAKLSFPLSERTGGYRGVRHICGGRIGVSVIDGAFCNCGGPSGQVHVVRRKEFENPFVRGLKGKRWPCH